MLKYWWSLLLVALCACSPQSVTAPPPPQDVQTPVAAVQPVATPQGVATSPLDWAGKIGAYAAFEVVNKTTAKQSYTAYITDFDNQSVVLQSKSGTVAPNDTFSGTFNMTCVQIDVTQGAAGAAPFLFGFINHEGKVVESNQIDRSKCQPPQPGDCKVGEWGEWVKTAETACVIDESVVVIEGYKMISYKRTRPVITQPSNGGAACPALEENKSEKVPCKIERKECADYEKPNVTINGDILVSIEGNGYSVTAGTVGPSGGTFSPALPINGTRPVFGQPSIMGTTTYSITKPYGPEELKCSVSDKKSFPYEIKAQGCEATWVPQPAVEENVSEWSKCKLLTGASVVPMCNALQTQTYELVVYEKNSCTAESRVKSREKKSRTKDCSYSPITTNAGHLVLTADKDNSSGNHGDTYYRVYKKVSGDDIKIYESRLNKGVVVNIPVFGFKTGDEWYVRYSNENVVEGATALATCTEGVVKSWHPTLKFVCDKSTSCSVE